MKTLPSKFLKFEWFPTLQDRPEEFKSESNVNAMLVKDKGALIKILCRRAVVSEEDPHGPINKKIWLDGYHNRILAMTPDWPAGLKLRPDSTLDWDLGGHYQLVPNMPKDCPRPADHRYTGFVVMNLNVEVSFSGPIANAVTGEWKAQKTGTTSKRLSCTPHSRSMPRRSRSSSTRPS